MTKELKYEMVLKQIAEGSDAVPAEAWRYLAHTILNEHGVSSDYKQDVRRPLPDDEGGWRNGRRGRFKIGFS